MKTFGTVLVSVTVLALAGCGGASGTVAGTVTTSASVKPTRAKGTVAQYASIVAREKAGMGKLLDEMMSSNCDWTTPGNVDTRPGYTTCSIEVQTVGSKASALERALNDPYQGRSLDIGGPPDEIMTLVQRTMLDAGALKNYSGYAYLCTGAAPAADCRMTLSDFYDTMTWMQAGFASWSPYGV